MDTKLKNIRYSLGMKVVAVIIMWISIMGIVDSGIFLINNEKMIEASSYYDTQDFQWEVTRLIHNTVELGTTFQHGRSIGHAPRRYEDIKDNLSKAINFNYYIRDLRTGVVSYRVAGNYNPEIIKDQPNHIYISKDEIPYYHDIYYGDIEEMLIQSPQELYIFVSDPLKPGDVFYDDFISYSSVKELAPKAIAMLIITLILSIASFSYLVWVSGRKEKGGEIVLMGIDKIYNDVQSIFVLFAAFISMGVVGSMNFGNFNAELIFALTILSIDILIGMAYFFSMLRQYKKGMLLKNTLIFKASKKVINFIHTCFSEKIFKVWMIGWLLAYGFINGILFIMAIVMFANIYEIGLVFGVFVIVAFNIAAVYVVFKALRSLAKIMEAAKAISEGKLDYELDEFQMSMEFVNFAGDIQSIQGGLKNAVNKAIQGERMKTELITNVSHDLKTPLTSIINYVDLLKQEDVDNEKAEGYLSILEDKSNRLKQLIEDLIEVSKASSGNLVITTEEVNLQELIVQACGEYEEKIQDAQLDIRINSTDEKISVLADGKYMWRIVENIMSNALKYSMANSRVYINIRQNNGYGVLIMKNISSYPLDIDPEQLTERFTRGDESRTTEGSGLGLSIAQSLVDIQGGRFNIDIDGDLFKVTVEIPLWIVE